MALSLIMIFAVASMVGQIQGLQNHEFRLGTDATVSISFRLNGKHQYCCEIYSTDRSKPFCTNGTIDPEALRPDQRSRFKINVTLSQQILTIELHISNIQERDEGVYIWAVQEHLENDDMVYTSDVYVGVIIPPGRTECRVLPSPYSSGLREIHCRASVGSDGGGLLICFQNGVKAPFQSPPKISSKGVTAAFWMVAQYDIKCCSHEANYEKVAVDCNDFTEAALIESDNPVQLLHTVTIQDTAIMTTRATTANSINMRKSTEITEPCTLPTQFQNVSYLNSDQCEICNKSLHFNYILAICGIISVAIILQLCTIYYSKKGCKNGAAGTNYQPDELVIKYTSINGVV